MTSADAGRARSPGFSAGDDLDAALASAAEVVEPPVAALQLDRTDLIQVKGRLRFLFVLSGLSALGPFSIDMYLPALPEIAADLGSSAAAVQLSLTACLAGLALGQLLAGPFSDSRGRRLPVIMGLAGFVLTSFLCSLAPSVPVLVALRFMQGLFGAAGLVVGRAIVRDLFEAEDAARFFSMLMLIFGLAPVVAPLAGGQILRVAGWPAVFVVLGVLGALLLLAVSTVLPETLPPERRHRGCLSENVRSMMSLLRDRHLVGYALASGLGFAALFAYIAGSPFVVQNVYGASPQLFSLVFAGNALAVLVFGQVNARLVGRVSMRRLLTVGLGATCFSGLSLVLVVLGGIPGLAALIAPLFILSGSMSLIFPNATALALAEHPESAGSASALLGVLQFLVGAAVAPIVGLGGPDTAVPMVVTIAVAGTAAMVALVTLTGSGEKRVGGY